MSTPSREQLAKLTELDVYPASIVESGDTTYFLGARDHSGRRRKFVGAAGAGCLAGMSKLAELAGSCVCVCPIGPQAAADLRKRLPWTAPRPLGLATSIGTGDRLGLATPGHIRAVRGSGLLPVLAQQSIREMTRTRRTPQDVIDAATWGVFQEGWRDGFGADADHIQQPEGLDATAAAGCTLFTIDPGQHVNSAADAMSDSELRAAAAAMGSGPLGQTHEELAARYQGSVKLADGQKLLFDEPTLLRALLKYGNAIAHIVRMNEHLRQVVRRDFELEVSVDETATPTTPAEHYFIASELKRLGVSWVSLAPRFVGSFEKGVDYIGDLAAFRRELTAHVAVMRTLGPYKISIHSGSDKFSLYPIIAELCGGLVHLKTAGTSWLEALRAAGEIDPQLLWEIYAFALERYPADRQSYHVSASVERAPRSGAVTPAALLEDFCAREILHVTFGSVLTADDGRRFGGRLYQALESREEVYYEALARHIGRHVKPFAR
jgi:hypothetical protein